MKTSRFTEQQIALILQQVDPALGVDEVCRKAGVSQQTYYRWRGNLLIFNPYFPYDRSILPHSSMNSV